MDSGAEGAEGGNLAGIAVFAAAEEAYYVRDRKRSIPDRRQTRETG